MNEDVTTVIRTIAGYRVSAVYAGGPYIDLCFGDRAFEVINVWDYAAAKPLIPNTSEAVSAALTEWVSAAGNSLVHDLANYRESISR